MALTRCSCPPPPLHDAHKAQEGVGNDINVDAIIVTHGPGGGSGQAASNPGRQEKVWGGASRCRGRLVIETAWVQCKGITVRGFIVTSAKQPGP
jgi:hypothetical protein